MQRRLEANWQHHLLTAILQGHFMMTPDILLGLKHQISQVVNSDSIFQSNLHKLDSISIMAYDGDEESSAENLPKEGGSVVIIPVKGPMLKYGTYWSYGMDEIGYYLKHFASKKEVAAIVLDIDSGGGSISAIPPILDAIAFTKSLGKPIIAHCDTACSAAYWTASACDYIFANNNLSSVFGSIGVMISYLDLVPYYEKLGAQYHEVYADPSEDKNLAFQKFLKSDYEQIKKDMLNPSAVMFQNAVKTNRQNLKAETPGILSGATFYGAKSVDIGLADKIGTLRDAVNYASVKGLMNQ